MKKILSILLILSMLAALLTACQKPKPAAEETTADEGVDNPSELVLCENGKTEFRIVYNQMEAVKNPTVEAKINDLITNFQKYTGIKLKLVPTLQNTYNANAFEIFIGSTGYEETLAVSKDIRLTDYRIARSGNKIVIVGGNALSLSNAISHFTSKIVAAQGKETPERIVFGEAQELFHEGTYRHKQILVNGADLKDFTIVLSRDYSAAEYELANYLCYTIGQRYGYSLPIEYDHKEYAHEILIGKTARTTVTPATKTEYYVEITDKNVQIAAGCTSAYGYVDDLFTTFLINGKVESVKNDAYDEYVAKKDSMLVDEGELRIIFHNVLAYAHPDREGDYMAPTQRWHIQAALYADYQPDLLCLQEFNELPRDRTKNLKSQLTSMGYAEVPYQEINADHGDTPIFYNPEKVELLKYGTLAYKTPNNDNERYGGVAKMTTWGIFKDKTTGKCFVLFSAHLDHQDTADANARRALEAIEILELIENEICVGEYADLPVIIGGDINTSYNRENDKYGNTGALHNFEAAGFKDAQKTLDFADKINSYGGYPSYTESMGYIVAGNSTSGDSNASIDHCLYRGNVTFHTFDIMDHEYARKASDHLPLVVDITLP